MLGANRTPHSVAARGRSGDAGSARRRPPEATKPLPAGERARSDFPRPALSGQCSASVARAWILLARPPARPVPVLLRSTASPARRPSLFPGRWRESSLQLGLPLEASSRTRSLAARDPKVDARGLAAARSLSHLAPVWRGSLVARGRELTSGHRSPRLRGQRNLAAAAAKFARRAGGANGESVDGQDRAHVPLPLFARRWSLRFDARRYSPRGR